MKMNWQEISPGVYFGGIEANGVKLCWKLNETGTGFDSCDENGNPLALTMTPYKKKAKVEKGIMNFVLSP